MRGLCSTGLVALALLLSACPDGKLRGKGCNQDSDCGAPESAFRCETQTGVCFCRTDEACPPREFCNTVGFCKDMSGCEKNSDCIDPSLFCETSSGASLARDPR